MYMVAQCVCFHPTQLQVTTFSHLSSAGLSVWVPVLLPQFSLPDLFVLVVWSPKKENNCVLLMPHEGDVIIVMFKSWSISSRE